MHARLAIILWSGIATVAAAPAVSTSVTGRVVHDTNLFLQNSGPLASGQSKPGVPADEAATAAVISASIGCSWKEGKQMAADLSYAPEVTRYGGHRSENHADHVLAGAATAEIGDWSGNLTSRYTIVDGSSDSPVYNGLGGSPAIGGEPVRARRAQAIARASAKLTRKLPAGFVRAAAALFDQQFHTREDLKSGYCNYADRDETSGGLEAGWRAIGNMAFVGGIRTGFQRQANTAGVPLNFSNRFTRYLVGVEGSPIPTLKITLLAGPDVRNFGQSVRAGFERDQRAGYGEASVTWTMTKLDSLSVSGKRYLWMSSGGRGSYVDTLVDLGWRRKWNTDWSTSAGVNYHEGDTGHFTPWSPRDDRIYTWTMGVSRTLPKHARLDVELMHDWGLSMLPGFPSREYGRWIGSAAITRTW